MQIYLSLLYVYNPLEAFESFEVEITDIFQFFLISKFFYIEVILWLVCILLIFFLFLVDEPEEDDEDEEINNFLNYHFIIVISFFSTIILIQNLLGLVPYSSAETTCLLTNIFLSFSAVLMIWFELIYKYKSIFLSHFLPNGAPTTIAPFIILIEVVSTVSRIVSLAVRVFANMTAGHTLVEIIIGFSLVLLVFTFKLILFFIPIFVVLLIILLELLVVYLQAYVFETLLTIYNSELL